MKNHTLIYSPLFFFSKPQNVFSHAYYQYCLLYLPAKRLVNLKTHCPTFHKKINKEMNTHHNTKQLPLHCDNTLHSLPDIFLLLLYPIIISTSSLIICRFHSPFIIFLSFNLLNIPLLNKYQISFIAECKIPGGNYYISHYTTNCNHKAFSTTIG